MRSRRGVTLAELMMVLAIMAIASSAILPLVGAESTSRLRAAAELLAADIEDVQARSLAAPRAPICLLVDEGGTGWRLALVSDPGTPIPDASGRPRARTFGHDVLAGCEELELVVSELPDEGLRFDDQGAPVALAGPIDFRLRAEDGSTLRISVSASTGRVTMFHD